MSPMRGQALLLCELALQRGMVPQEREEQVRALMESFPPDETQPDALVDHGVLGREQLRQLMAESQSANRARRERVGKCPRCGTHIHYDTAVGDRIVCTRCQAILRIPGSAAPSSETDPLVGQRLGQFEILELLGRGGMGAVYKARQSSLDRLVAIKVLAIRLSHDSSFVERFAREARAAAAVSHPNVIEVFDVGHARGYQYIAMEYIDGQSLEALLEREGPLDVDQALPLMGQVASAVAAAHACGVLHRDIKPSNILLTRHGTAKVADFGLAKRPGMDVSVTATGAPLGTPLYLPPEVARGLPASAASDLYSLGATFYHLLAGKPPFEGATLVELAVKHAENRPVPLGNLRPDLPLDVCRTINRLLRKRPADRYASGEDLLRALDRIQLRREVSQSAATKTVRGTRDTDRGPAQTSRGPGRRRGPLVVAACGAALAILLVILGMALGRRGQRPEPQAKDTSESQEQRVAHDAVAARRERDAQTLLRNARHAADRKIWLSAQSYLNRMERDYADTDYYTENRGTISSLAAAVTAELGSNKEPGGQEPSQVPPSNDARWTEWEDLFDGKTLGRWRILEEGVAAKHGEVRVRDGQMALERGNPVTSIVWTGDFPTTDYEAMVDVTSFQQELSSFSVVLPVGPSHCLASFQFRGYRTAVVQLQDLDGEQPVYESRRAESRLKEGEWRRLRLRVADSRLRIWLDDEQLTDLALPEHTFTLASTWVSSRPFGIHAWQTRSALRSIRVRRLKPEPLPDDEARWGPWEELFDGKTLAGWKIVESFHPPRKAGSVEVEQGSIVLSEGADDQPAGFVSASDGPRESYEVAFEAMRVQRGKSRDGPARTDIIFPVGPDWSVLVIMGSDSGRGFGLSNVDDWQYGDRRCTVWRTVDDSQWYKVRLSVTKAAIRAWLGGELLIDQPRAGHGLQSLGWNHRFLKPLGFMLYVGKAHIRNIRLRHLRPEAVELKAGVRGLLTVRQDGKGDFTGIQAALDAAPANGVVEIQDEGPYNEVIEIGKGITLRGKEGCWPVLTAVGRLAKSERLVTVRAPGVSIERLVLVHSDPGPTNPCCLAVFEGPTTVRSAIVYCALTRNPSGYFVNERSKCLIENCVLLGKGTNAGPLVVTDSVWLRKEGGYLDVRATARFTNCMLRPWQQVPLGPCEWSQCTVPHMVKFAGPGTVVRDSIVEGIEADDAAMRIEHCDVFGRQPFAGLAKQGEGCFSAEPQFADPAQFDYRLKPTSPCRGKASDGGDIGCRFTPEMLEMLRLAHELRRKGLLHF